MCRARPRAAHAAWCVEREGSCDRPVTVAQNTPACRMASSGRSRSSSSRSGAIGVAVEPQREVVGGKDLAEGDRRRRSRCVEHRDGCRVHAQALGLQPHVAAERVVAHLGDQAHAVAVTRGGDGDVRGAAAEELREGADLLQADPVLQGVDVDAGAAHGDDLGGRGPGGLTGSRGRVRGAHGVTASESATARMCATEARTSDRGSTPVSAGDPVRMVSCSSTYQPS